MVVTAAGFAIAVLLCLVLAACSPAPSGGEEADAPAAQLGQRRSDVLLLDADLETGDFLQFDDVEAASHELQIVTEPVRAGRLAARAVVEAGEEDVGGSGNRAEATEQRAGGANQERERWFGFSTFLPADWQVVESPGSDILFQIHELPDACETPRSPPLALRLVGTEMRWQVRWDSRSCSIGNDAEGEVTVASRPLVLDRWVDWVVHVRWSYGADGLVEIWQAGDKVGDYRGPNAYNDRKPMYLKVGMYRSGSTWPDGLRRRVGYFDEVRMAGAAGTYADVAPGS